MNEIILLYDMAIWVFSMIFAVAVGVLYAMTLIIAVEKWLK